MPDPASTKQTTADLVAKLRREANAYFVHITSDDDRMRWLLKDAADALESLAVENERLHGIEERIKAAYSAWKPSKMLIHILHGDANAGGGE